MYFVLKESRFVWDFLVNLRQLWPVSFLCELKKLMTRNVAFLPPDPVLTNKLDVDCEDTHPG